MALMHHDSRTTSQSDTIVHQTTIPRPYESLSTETLATCLEFQYERGEPFDAEMVWEALHRAADAEGLLAPTQYVEKLDLQG